MLRCIEPAAGCLIMCVVRRVWLWPMAATMGNVEMDRSQLPDVCLCNVEMYRNQLPDVCVVVVTDGSDDGRRPVRVVGLDAAPLDHRRMQQAVSPASGP